MVSVCFTNVQPLSPFVFQGEPCTNLCDCSGSSSPIEVTLDTPLPMPLPLQIEVRGVPKESAGIGCDLYSYAILNYMAMEDDVLSAASNVVQPAPGFPLDIQLERPARPCGPDDCPGRSPGDYELHATVQDIYIPPDGMEVRVGNYLVVNEFSKVNGECEEVVRWHAIRASD